MATQWGLLMKALSLFHCHCYYLFIFLLLSLEPVLHCIVSGPCLDATAFCLFNLFCFWRLFKFILWGKPDVPGLCHLCQVTDFTGPWNKVWQFQHLFKSDGVNLNITGWRLLGDNLLLFECKYKNTNGEMSVKSNIHSCCHTASISTPFTWPSALNPILHHPHQRLIRLPSSMTAVNLGDCWS